MVEISRARYRQLFGPTTGDRVRLADTDLFIEVEQDLSAGGDEAVFGGGKVIRESMGQSARTRAQGAPDLVITGALILDHWGVIKADVGVRDGRIVGIGKAGNPDTMNGVHPALVIGPSTEILAGNGRILTAGAIDCHVHLICPQIVDTALASGVTTLIGGGTGPAEGTKATTVTPGAWYLARMHESMDTMPVNVVLLGKGNTVSHDSMHEQVLAGACGFKLHEDWGTTPAAIDACLTVADQTGVQVSIHTDTLNEAGYVESTLAAIAGRSIHTYHTEGAGGGHAPDIITVASQPNVLPSSTNPTRPHTVNTLAEHLDMLMVCHHLNSSVPEDLAFAESRIRPSTIAAEDVLHDMGAISIIGSDAQAMGRVGEVIIRTWQTAHVMKRRRGSLPGDTLADNHRARRYVAKYTICPAVTHGLDHEIGSIAVGKLADLVLWDPRFFGVRPHVVLKGGFIAWAAMGDANASIPTPQPVLPRPMFGASPRAAASTSLTFVAQAALDDGLAERLGLWRRLVASGDTRSIGKADLPENDALPSITVDPDTFAVHVDGELIEEQPVAELPMAQRYFLVLMGAAALLLLADSRFPTGAHAHSAGTEASHGRGDIRSIADLASFLDGRLATTARTEAAFAAASCAQPGRRADLDRELAARTPSPRLRVVSRTLGRQLLRAASRAWPAVPVVELRALHADGPMQPIALGAVAAAAGLSAHDAALCSLHHLLGAVTTAAVRLLGLDPFDVQALAAARADQLDVLAADAAALAVLEPADLPATTSLLADVLAEHHTTWEVRLFAS